RNFPQGADLEGGKSVVLAEDHRLQELAGPSVEVPTGHGFCLYVKRSCIRAVGFLDEPAFGRGYGEEVDFCLRAREAGFKHICAPNVFVGHVGGVSFGSNADSMKKRNRDLLAKKYPRYAAEVSE